MAEAVPEPIGTTPSANGARAAIADGKDSPSEHSLNGEDATMVSKTLESPVDGQSTVKQRRPDASDVEIALPSVEKTELPAYAENGIAPASLDPDPLPDTPAAKRLKGRRQSADATVSKTKFDREMDAYRRHEEAYRSRGWLLIEASFPTVFLVLGVPQVKPPCILFGLILDFTNYDIEPISVRVVDPFTKRLLTTQELLSHLPRKLRATPNQVSQQPPDSPQALADEMAQPDVFPQPADPILVPQVVTLLQSWGPTDVPFLCLPGVLEYHRHPGHTGDSWLRYRGTGVGTLDSILNAFHTYGVQPVSTYGINVSLRPNHDGTVSIAGAQITGFVTEIPA